MSDIRRLLDIMAALRAPDKGCPWDRQQTFATIVPHTLEEAYEVADAIERGDMGGLRDELGDLLFQIVFYAQMASESGYFDFDDIVQATAEKLVRRHPHVFGNAEIANADAQTEAWEAHKAEERRMQAPEEIGVLDGVARALPALTRAMKLQHRAARVGFDWRELSDVWGKLEEELEELREALGKRRDLQRIEELGDLLFTVVNLARHASVDAESALRYTNDKFEGRFRFIEAELQKQGRDIEEASLEEMDLLWEQAKRG